MAALFPIAVLLVLLPFEPMAPLARAFGLQVSLLELEAFLLLGASAAFILARRPRPPIPLLLPALLFLAAYLASALPAEGPLVLPLKFTARMAAGVAGFIVTSLALFLAPRFSLLFSCLSAAGAVSAAIALLEAGPWSFDEPLLAPFREHAFEVGGRPRVAATFSYPNTAGGFLALALAPTLYFFVRDRSRLIAALTACGISVAILFTYSRGALLGAAAAALTFAWLVRDRRLLQLECVLLAAVAAFFVLEPSFRWRASSEDDRSWYQALIEPRATVLALEPRELSTTVVRVENAGTLTWGSTGEKPFHLSYRWFRLAGESDLRPVPIEGERTSLLEPLAPGESVQVAATVRAPAKPGSYVLIWDMVHEHTTWFSDKVGLGVPVKVTVGEKGATAPAAPGEIRAAVAEKSWRPGRAELWSIAFEMFRANPLLGAGPDNFRWLYGPVSGHGVWDTRIHSNSLYLELLATVGLLGICAFALLAGRALLELRRRAESGPHSLEAATLAASLVSFLAHGVFDYILAFTPIYLAVFLLFGASSAVLREESSTRAQRERSESRSESRGGGAPRHL